MEVIHIEVLKMDNGEILSNGHSLGFDRDGKFKTLKRFDAMTGEEIEDNQTCHKLDENKPGTCPTNCRVHGTRDDHA